MPAMPVNLSKDSPAYRMTVARREVQREQSEQNDRTNRALRVMIGATTVDYVHPRRVTARV